MAEPSRALPPRNLSVMEVIDITPHLRRIRFCGEDLHDFPEDQESSYVKLLLEHQGELVRRPYTVRKFDFINKILDIDFVLHGDAGPASAWAAAAKVGDCIPVGGPGSRKLVDFSADWFLLAGDMTALPAISVNLEKLPPEARGYAAIEVVDAADVQPLSCPAGVEVHWVINPEPRADHFPLLNKVREFELLPGRPFMWVAGEFHTSREIRRYLKFERQVSKQDLYASSYWHIGLSEDRHKQVKAEDVDL